MARDGLSKTGHHGEMGAMGVPLTALPMWRDIQMVTAQFATKPLMEDVTVGTDLVIGPDGQVTETNTDAPAPQQAACHGLG